MEKSIPNEQFVHVTHTGDADLYKQTPFDSFLAKRLSEGTAKWAGVLFLTHVAVAYVWSCVETLQVNLNDVFHDGLYCYMMSYAIAGFSFLGLRGFSSAGIPVSHARFIKGTRAKFIGTFVLLFAASLTGVHIFLYLVLPLRH